MDRKKKKTKKRYIEYSFRYWIGPKPTYFYPHWCEEWEECECDAESQRDKIGMWNSLCGPEIHTHHCRFESFVRQGSQGRPDRSYSRFACIDGDDTDHCMSISPSIPDEEMLRLAEWVKNQIILDVPMIHKRLKDLGWRYE